jgi:hypothetical protein
MMPEIFKEAFNFINTMFVGFTATLQVVLHHSSVRQRVWFEKTNFHNTNREMLKMLPMYISFHNYWTTLFIKATLF